MDNVFGLFRPGNQVSGKVTQPEYIPYDNENNTSATQQPPKGTLISFDCEDDHIAALGKTIEDRVHRGPRQPSWTDRIVQVNMNHGIVTCSASET